MDAFEDDFGKVIYKDDKVVIRLKYFKNKKEVHVCAHLFEDGQEFLPLGYMLGSNMMHYDYGK